MDIHFSLGGDEFIWDDGKARRNAVKHGVRFEEAAAVFGDPFLVLVNAARNDEVREAAIGFDHYAL